MKIQASQITRALLAWYGEHRRNLPWRERPDPYGIWVSEIMLQQTQVDTVIPYYLRFLDHFPTVADLAAAPVAEVLKIWENLGYYARARNLHRAANIICDRYEGRIPDTMEELGSLPGIGPYTAGAILSMAFGKPAPAVDGNVRRVLSRLFAIEAPINQPKTQKALQILAESLIPLESPGDFNQALMDLGAGICSPKTPSCPSCPFRRICRAFLSDLQDRLPVSAGKPPIPHKRAVAAIIRNREGKVLIVQRPAQGLLASLWKFPGGFSQNEESPADGLMRTVQEELGLRIHAGDEIASIRHAYTHFRMTLTVFQCVRRSGRPRALTCQDWRWAKPDDLKHLAFSKADRAIIPLIQSDRSFAV